MNVPVEDAEEDDGETSEDDIIQLYVPLIEYGHRAEATPVGVEVVREGQRNVLVEEI